MQKPPFQFGLKAIFVATTGVAILMACGDAGRTLVLMVVLWSMAAVILLAVLAVFAIVKKAIIGVARLIGWTANQFRLPSQGRSQGA